MTNKDKVRGVLKKLSYFIHEVLCKNFPDFPNRGHIAVVVIYEDDISVTSTIDQIQLSAVLEEASKMVTRVEPIESTNEVPEDGKIH